MKFSTTAFQTVCKTVTGENLDYVTFDLPSSSYGKLYYRYTSASKYDSAVSATKKYYRSGTPDLGQVSFVPKSGYTGKVTLSYTGYSESGRDYEGKVVLTVKKAGDEIISYKVSDRRVCDFSSSDFNKVCEALCGCLLYTSRCV